MSFFKDRTSEFNSVVETLRLQAPKPVSTKAVASFPPRSTFSVIASKLGYDIAKTSEKLSQLAKLARKRSLFDDPVFEIQQLTAEINQDIKKLSEHLETLKIQRQASIRNKQADAHTETVVDALKWKLGTATKDFTQVLEQRTETLKAQQKERENFTGSHSSEFGRRANESPLYKSTTPSESNGEVAIAMPTSGALLVQQQDRFIVSRAQAVDTIRDNIAQLGQIFQQLSLLVAQQQDLVERIDSNVANSEANVTGAQQQLLKYLSGLNDNRWLVMKLFLVLVVFVVIFVVFFV